MNFGFKWVPACPYCKSAARDCGEDWIKYACGAEGDRSCGKAVPEYREGLCRHVNAIRREAYSEGYADGKQEYVDEWEDDGYEYDELCGGYRFAGNVKIQKREIP